jgi:predicted dehydrogenase
MRFGLLGTGYWAAETHAAALAAHPEAEFAAVWGRDPGKAAALARRYGAECYDSADDLIKAVDAVAIALPPDVQAVLAEKAAAAGRHLLLDKPVALTAQAADRVAAAARDAGVASAVFFTKRFETEIETFLGALAASGPWDGARVTLLYSIYEPASPYAGSAWRREHGGLWDIGPHALSVVLPVLGPVERVAAASGPHETTHVLLTHASGAVSTLALTLSAPENARASEYLFAGPPGFATLPASSETPVEAFGHAIGELIAAAAEGNTEHRCGAGFGAEVTRVLAAAETARRDGVTVTVGGSGA